MTRLILFLGIIAAPVVAIADGSTHADRITWQVPAGSGPEIPDHADRITWQVGRDTPERAEPRPVATQRTGHADIITWDCPTTTDVVN